MVTVIYISDKHFRIMDYELGQIEFDEYLDFYVKKMVDRFDKPVPPEDEKKERPTPPPKTVEPKEVPVPEEESPTPSDKEDKDK